MACCFPGALEDRELGQKAFTFFFAAFPTLDGSRRQVAGLLREAVEGIGHRAVDPELNSKQSLETRVDKVDSVVQKLGEFGKEDIVDVGIVPRRELKLLLQFGNFALVIGLAVLALLGFFESKTVAVIVNELVPSFHNELLDVADNIQKVGNRVNDSSFNKFLEDKCQKNEILKRGTSIKTESNQVLNEFLFGCSHGVRILLNDPLRLLRRLSYRFLLSRRR